MRTILTVGFDHLLLPRGVNVNAILKALDGAKRLRQRYTATGLSVWELEGSPEVSLRQVEQDAIVDPKLRKRIPEQTGGPY